MRNGWMVRAAIAMGVAGWLAWGGIPGARAADAPASLAAQGTNQFAYDLFGRLKDRDGGATNLFYSPYSIESAVAMTYAGARGQTADEILSAIDFPMPQQKAYRTPAMDRGIVVSSFAALNKQLSGNWEGTGFSLTVANSLWGKKGEPFLADYVDTIKKDFDGDLSAVDFAQPEAVRQQVNQWVASQTHDKIKDLLAPGTVTPEDRLILANAIYFKGAWMSPFNAKQTSTSDFHTQHGEVVQAKMMHATHSLYYAEDDMCQMVELPYNGGQLAMLVLLPKPNETAQAEDGKPDRLKIGMHRLESALTPAYVAKLEGQLADRPVTLALPKWDVTQSISLGSYLQAMGMKQAFTSDADFSGIDGRTDLFISGVIHKAFVNVDEKGTEAAGATAIVMMGGAPQQTPPPPVAFTADHPFIYFIVHQPTHTILFAGRLCDPNAG